MNMHLSYQPAHFKYSFTAYFVLCNQFTLVCYHANVTEHSAQLRVRLKGSIHPLVVQICD